MVAHDELYSYIEFQCWTEDYKLGKNRRLYRKIQRNGTVIAQQITLTEYIRHQIHHPENLKSIIKMRAGKRVFTHRRYTLKDKLSRLNKRAKILGIFDVKTHQMNG